MTLSIHRLLWLKTKEEAQKWLIALRLNLDEFAKIFPTAPGLDIDLGRVGMTLDTLDKEISGSIEFSEYYANLHGPQAGSGEITPISYGSEAEFNTTDATAGSSSAPDFDFTITEDIDKDDITDNNETLTSAASKTFINNCHSLRSSFVENNTCSGSTTPKLISPSTANINVFSNNLKSAENYPRKPISNIKRAQSLYSRKSDVDNIDVKNLVKDYSKFERDLSGSNPNVNVTNVGYLKWTTSKEKFFDVSKDSKTDNVDFGKNLNTGAIKKIEKDSELMTKLNLGAILVKESYIESPKISRVSKSFHGKSPTNSSFLDISTVPRRASDIPITSKNLNESSTSLKSEIGFNKNELVSRNRPQFLTQMSQPCGESSRCSGNLTRKTSLTTETAARNSRFTTTRVDEAELAASVDIVNWPNRCSRNKQSSDNNTSRNKSGKENPD